MLVLSFNRIAVPAAAASDVWVDDVTDPDEDGIAALPCDSIQQGIDNVDAGGTVHVLAGTYYENINLRDGVDVIGEDGASSTTINAGGSGQVVNAWFIGSGTMFYGFTISSSSSQGMLNSSSSLTVSNCAFIDNLGRGMWNDSSSPVLIGCSFTGNSAIMGGGMYYDFSNTTLIDCTFTGNDGLLTMPYL